MMVFCIFHPGVWRRKWQPTLVFLLGKSHGQKSLVGYSSWVHKESDTIEWLNNTETPWNKPNSKLKQRKEKKGKKEGKGKRERREERGEMLSKQGYRKKRETGRVWSYCSFSGWIWYQTPFPCQRGKLSIWFRVPGLRLHSPSFASPDLVKSLNFCCFSFCIYQKRFKSPHHIHWVMSLEWE